MRDGRRKVYFASDMHLGSSSHPDPGEAEQKVVECHERQVTRILSKKQKVQYRILTGDGFWSWSNEEELMKMLRMLSE